MELTTRSGIVTPEAVVLAFDTAGAGTRLLAILIDLTAQLATLLAVLFGFSILGKTHFGLVGVFIGVFAVAFIYPVAIETLWRGRSLGKAAMGLRVVTIEGAPIRFRHALIRGALGLIDFWTSSGAVALLAVLVTPRNQRLGDLVAGTLVLRERTGARAPVEATFTVPPGWDAYAATIDVSALDPAAYGAVRSFLLRAATLDPVTRDTVARQLAGPVAARVRHTPPPGVTAEAFCACVAALYQARQRRVAQGSPPTVPPPPPSSPSAPSIEPRESGHEASRRESEHEATRRESEPGPIARPGGFAPPG